jgi:predicted TIM-barrel fold metal-dependent hydrolase
MDRKAWRDQVVESALEAGLPIVDAHHHVWGSIPLEPFEYYDLETLLADKVGAGHNIIATVYVDSRSGYRTEGPEAFRVVGETEFADRMAQTSLERGGRVAGACASIVSNVDLTLGTAAGAVFDAHIAASRRFRGVRHLTAFDADVPSACYSRPHVMMQPAFRAGFAELARRGLTFDAWLHQTQLPELIDLAQAFPSTDIVLDHTGGPLVLGRYTGRSGEAFADWRRDMALLAKCPNVSVKLGGLNMGLAGVDASARPRPYTSLEVGERQRGYILTTIDVFGPERCMFESNFPVDMRCISYGVLWNAFKRMTADFSAAERALLFSGTATRFYRIENARAT